jgi:hypothetical protein
MPKVNRETRFQALELRIGMPKQDLLFLPMTGPAARIQPINRKPRTQAQLHFSGLPRQ